MMNNESGYKYAIELSINYIDRIEDRVLSVLLFLKLKYPFISCSLSEIEASGREGILLSNRQELEEWIEIVLDDIIQIFKEDGQVFELDMLLTGKKVNIWLLICDGQHVNIISNDYSLLDKDHIGDFKYLDLSLFTK